MIDLSTQFKYRLVEVEDAKFILDLRTNLKLNKYINPTSIDLDLQKEWIEEYKKREKLNIEHYFLFFENDEPRGTYRIYNVNKYSFTIGSWLFNKCEEKMYPIIADLEMGDFGFYSLNKEIMLFDVRKNNKKVINYHLLKMPLIYNEDEDNLYFIVPKTKWEDSKSKIKAIIGI